MDLIKAHLFRGKLGRLEKSTLKALSNDAGSTREIGYSEVPSGRLGEPLWVGRVSKPFEGKSKG